MTELLIELALLVLLVFWKILLFCLTLAFVFSPVFLVLGLINPKLVSEKETRLEVLTQAGTAVIVLLILVFVFDWTPFGIGIQPTEAQIPLSSVQSQTPSPSESMPPVSASAPSRSFEEIRGPREGSCQCPYDLDSRGRECGGRSAYSRPGGSSPVCYVGE